jgi:uncharacterized membrane protein
MGKGRLEAFSDGVMAVIITIMVLELHPPQEPTLEALAGVAHPFVAYVLSFIYVGIYWNNHHHMFQSVEHVNGRVLWTNNLLLFCLSLVPFSTNWMGETDFALVPTIVYGISLVLPAIGRLPSADLSKLRWRYIERRAGLVKPKLARCTAPLTLARPCRSPIGKVTKSLSVNAQLTSSG